MSDDTPGDQEERRALEKERTRGSNITDANDDNAAAMGSTSPGKNESHLRQHLEGGGAEGTAAPGEIAKQLGVSNSRSQLAKLRPKRPKQRAVIRSEDSSVAHSEASL